MKNSRPSSAAATSVPVPPAANTHTRPDHQTISARARDIWREKGCPSGRDEEIWLQAERELMGTGAKAAAGISAKADAAPAAAKRASQASENREFSTAGAEQSLGAAALRR